MLSILYVLNGSVPAVPAALTLAALNRGKTFSSNFKDLIEP